MRRVGPALSLSGFAVLVAACGGEPAPPAKNAAPPNTRTDEQPVTTERAPAPAPSQSSAIAPPSAVLDARTAPCRAADWSPRSLPALLSPGKVPNTALADQTRSDAPAFEAGCGDFPGGPPSQGAPRFVRDGVEVRVKDTVPAGTSGRQWPGNQCTFEVAFADGSGRPVELGPDVVPPFNAITAVVASGSAAWLEISFNGYTREFPKGGNRVVAVDVCDGRVVWKSKDGTSNGGLLLFGDYLVTAFGFTSERRFVHVLDARSGAAIQKLGVIENICPSKAWAPNWDGGRCDAPGQSVGAAKLPRIEGGLFLVDTNTGSSAFQVK